MPTHRLDSSIVPPRFLELKRLKGFVPTPAVVVDLMVSQLFLPGAPRRDAQLLDPGCGNGEFIEGVLRWCAARRIQAPQITGVESDQARARLARERFRAFSNVQVLETDFLVGKPKKYDYIVGNPPYVPLTGLDVPERVSYRRTFATAKGRFDLYLLFFEQALRALADDGRLVFITPEKFLYVESGYELRSLLGNWHLEELRFLPEDTFGHLVTYPLVSTVAKAKRGPTRVVGRDGSVRESTLPSDGGSWLPAVRGAGGRSPSVVLSEVCERISCGVATGADSVFVVRDSELSVPLRRFAYPTISGRELGPSRDLLATRSMLVPYASDGTLMKETDLGSLLDYFAEPGRRERLLRRTCVARKPWYAFHETPPMNYLLRPKILCKDIGASPFFIADRSGGLVPRHSVYYIVPSKAERIDELLEYLNSPAAHEWLRDHCQRAANGFLRLQSHVLKRLPIPGALAPEQSGLFNAAVG